MTRLLTLIALLFSLSSPALALDSDEMFADPAQEARAREIGRQLRCLKCRNQSIFDSNAGLARDLRVVVRERMLAGDSDRDVLEYVHERFGDYVLLKPPDSAKTYALWGTPFVMLLAALGGAALYLRQRPVPRKTADLSDEDRAEARRLLQGDTQ
jgi:cytochrome c-type biogenesis protein CcmH